MLWTLGPLLAAGCAGQVRYESSTPSAPTQPTTLEASVYLVGDAGDDSPGRAAVLGHLYADLARREGSGTTVPTVVVFLGDNIYDVGAREAFKAEDLAHLRAQVEAVEASRTAHAVFLPGNHDWAKGAEEDRALAAIRAQAEWLAELVGEERASFRPGDGCPGPSGLDVGPSVRLVFLDTEWLLRRPANGCGTPEQFYAALRAELTAHAGRRVLLAAHHPMATGGPHGGNVDAFHRGPLVYYLAVKAGLSVQDLASGRYSEMVDGIRRAIVDSGTRPLAFVAGHDHSLQVIGLSGRDNPAFQLVSGSGSKTSPVDRIEGTRYAASAHGYMRLDFGPSENRLTVFALEGDQVHPVFGCALVADEPEACPEARRVVDP